MPNLSLCSIFFTQDISETQLARLAFLGVLGHTQLT